MRTHSPGLTLRRFFSTIDDLLRGNLTRKEDLAAGRIDVPVRTLVVAGVLLGATYGVTMGLFAPLRAANPSFGQLLATAAKVPLLFFLTLVVTYPSLYVVSAMFDSKLRHRETLRLLLAAMGANLALLASLGPVTAFFTLCTDSYAFMVVLNVLFFVIAGVVGLGFLQRALNSVFDEPPRPPVESPASPFAPTGAPAVATESPADAPSSESGGGEEADAGPRDAPTSALPPSAIPSPPEQPRSFGASSSYASKPQAAQSGAARHVFNLWIVIYSIVGAQMGWVLRPFIGAPDLPFELFRSERESNFFAAVAEALGKLFQ